MAMPNAAISAAERRALASQSMKAAVATRAKARLDQQRPICIYDLCERLGVTVRFNDINMEGMYEKGDRPRIHLSAKRPLPRRVFNCAHELGHHIFKHGSSIDELKESAQDSSWDDPNEFLADTFAGFVLMPIVGLRHAFASRSWDPVAATAAQLFVVACDFGVGYRSLITHLSAGVGLISWDRALTLKKVPLKRIYSEIIGCDVAGSLIVADKSSRSTVLDVEVEGNLVLPRGVEVRGENIVFDRETPSGLLYVAKHSGIARAVTQGGDWATFVRVAPKEYVGLAQYRHLEEDADDED